MIKNLIFDFGKVLVQYDFDLLFRRLVADETKRAKFSVLFNDPEWIRQMDLGVRTFDELMDEYKGLYPDIAEEIEVFRRRKYEVVTGEEPGMRELLTRLKAMGYKLYGLTNWDQQVHITIAQFDIFRLLDGIIISSEEKVVKPEPEIYQRLFRKFGLNPQECIFTDDKIENIEGSERVGMKGILFRNALQYWSELQKYLQ